MHIQRAIHDAILRDEWIKPFVDRGKMECIVRFIPSDSSKITVGQTSFDIDAMNADRELNELWETLWKELGAASYESVTRVFIKGRVEE